MDKYYVNDDPQPNGDHEVHKANCRYFPKNVTYLGTFSSCVEAVREAKKKYSRADGCYYCSSECHKR
jgi:hypothetical protein